VLSKSFFGVGKSDFRLLSKGGNMQQCQSDSTGRLMHAGTMALRKYLENRLRPYGLTAEQFQVLKQLALDGGVSQNMVCEAVSKSPANITRILDRLEIKKYLERRDNPNDRRSSLVFLTDTGRDLMDRVLVELADLEEMVTKGIPEENLIIMRNGLLQVLNNLESYNSDGE
jgi:DNA-binding MarR family transcriptional regulator